VLEEMNPNVASLGTKPAPSVSKETEILLGAVPWIMTSDPFWKRPGSPAVTIENDTKPSWPLAYILSIIENVANFPFPSEHPAPRSVTII
jgi:hypothetical protein